MESLENLVQELADIHKETENTKEMVARMHAGDVLFDLTVADLQAQVNAVSAAVATVVREVSEARELRWQN